MIVDMASGEPTLERSGEMRERPSLEGEQPNPTTALHRTPEIHETQSGNVELRQNPNQSSKLANPEQILDPRNSTTASQPEDVLAYRRDQADTPLE